MSAWNAYPLEYRSKEVQTILRAVTAGESAAVVGLSGAGKSNLMGFLTHRTAELLGRFPGRGEHAFILVDCNRLRGSQPADFYRLVRKALGSEEDIADELSRLEAVTRAQLIQAGSALTLLFDRFDSLAEGARPAVYSNLRALRDEYKYSLTYITASRRPIDPHNELAELFFAHTLWLGPLSEDDALWSIERFTTRSGLQWEPDACRRLIELTGGYPSLLRAACETYAAGVELNESELLKHPAVQKRVEEFWSDAPTGEELHSSGLAGLSLLQSGAPGQKKTPGFEVLPLTAKEHLLLEALRALPNQVREKDELIQAVWPEDKIYAQGIRDDSLAQLVRRLREKIEHNPSAPVHILTVPGRGYRFIP